MNPIWLIRMARWARRPPSRRVLITVGVTITLALALASWEYFLGWPTGLTVDSPRGLPRLRPLAP